MVKVGDIVTLVGEPEERGEVLEIAKNGTILVCILEAYRMPGDVDGLVEVTEDQVQS